jgi:copper chaperone
MEKIVLKTNLSCSHCVQKVEPVLKNEEGIVDYSIDLEHPDKPVTIFSEGANISSIIAKFKKVGYIAAKL